MTSSSPFHRRILIVDDNEEIHSDYRKILAPAAPAPSDVSALELALLGECVPPQVSEVYELDSAYQGQEALAKVVSALEAGRPYSVAFIDMQMPPGWDGLETIERLWQVAPDLQVVICTAYSDRSRDDIIERTGRTHRLLILKKPFDVTEIAQLACAMSEKWLASRMAALKMSELEELVEARTAEIVDAKKQVERSEERYALAAQGANDGLWDWDTDSGHVFFSARWKSILGLPPEWTGCTIDEWLGRIHPDDRPRVDECLQKHLRGDLAAFECEHRVRRSDGVFVWALCRGMAVRDSEGRCRRMAGSLSDISRRKDTEDKLRRGAYYDRLTGLPNRALLRECLEQAAQEFRTDATQRFGILFLDFDRFKVVNDSLGHPAGDQLLVAIAGRLTSCLATIREHSREQTMARLGGDEFVVLLRGISGERDLVRAAETLQRSFRDPISVHGHLMHTTCSIGVALATADNASPDDILRDADMAMYHAKAQGRACHAIFDSSMRAHAMARLRLENDLRKAIAEGAIHVLYQPIICLRTGLPVSIEALARWTHPAEGQISPDRFIPIAEEIGLIGALGERVLRTACRDIKTIQSNDPRWSSIPVNVNLSPKQISHGSLADLVAQVMGEAGISAASLGLEVTETAVIEDFNAAAATIHRLRAMGVSVYMDDFGIGYSSLSCLKSLPLTGLKLDRSFVAQMGEGAVVPAIIHAVVTIAEHLRLSVVAEGVESNAQLAGLLAANVDRAQGYLFSRPIALPELLEWLKSQHEGVRIAA